MISEDEGYLRQSSTVKLFWRSLKNNIDAKLRTLKNLFLLSDFRILRLAHNYNAH